MFRFALISTAMMIATGCTTNQSGQFTHESTLNADTRGVAFTDDNSAEVGMESAVCEGDVASGTIGTDTDVAMGDDRVLAQEFGVVLVTDGDSLYTYEPTDFGSGDVIAGGGVVDAGFVDSGIVSVNTAPDGLNVNWLGLDVSTNVPGGVGNGMTVDPASGTVFVGSEEGVVAVTPEGITPVADGDLMVWDSAANVLYVATDGDSELRGYDLDGTERFAVELGGEIHSLEALGSRAQALALVELEDGGQLVTVDGMTGEISNAMGTPGGRGDLSSSPSGDTIAIAVQRQVFFLRNQ